MDSENHIHALRSGVEPHKLVADFLNSEEFSLRRPLGQRTAVDMAATRCPGARPPSDPEIEVIRHEMWLPGDRPRILLLKLDHIGDFVMTLDAFRLIRDTWPRADITLVCGPWNKSIAERSGLFDTVVSCNFYPDITTDFDKEAVIKRETRRISRAGSRVLRSRGGSRDISTTTGCSCRTPTRCIAPVTPPTALCSIWHCRRARKTE